MDQANRGIMFAPDTEDKKISIRHILIGMHIRPTEYRLHADDKESQLLIFAKVTAEQERLLRRCLKNLTAEKITLYG